MLTIPQYYDTENISESTLSFRNAVNEPRYHFQSDEYCMKHLYNIGQYVKLPRLARDSPS